MVAITNFTRIDNDRYVCHFTNLSVPDDQQIDVTQRYNLALFRAKALGGKRFHTKQYGGGIAFTTDNLHDLCKRMNQLTGK